MGVLSNNKDVTAVQARCLGAVSEFSVLRRGGREGETVVRPIILLFSLHIYKHLMMSGYFHYHVCLSARMFSGILKVKLFFRTLET